MFHIQNDNQTPPQKKKKPPFLLKHHFFSHIHKKNCRHFSCPKKKRSHGEPLAFSSLCFAEKEKNTWKILRWIGWRESVIYIKSPPPPPLIFHWFFFSPLVNVFQSEERSAQELADLKKKRQFRKFTYRGIELEKLMDISHEELTELLPARARRRFNRGMKRKPMALIKVFIIIIILFLLLLLCFCYYYLCVCVCVLSIESECI